MPRAHHRARSSIDRALDLLADLDDTQMEALLQEANSTVSSNVAVSQAVDKFERERMSMHSSMNSPTRTTPRPPRKFLTSLSPRKTAELRRRGSNRVSSAPEPRARNRSSLIDPSAAASQPAAPSPKTTSRSYKRISRPFGTPASSGAAQDLRNLLVAYLSGSLSPNSAATSDASSPASTRSFASSTAFPPAPQREESPGLDLLEPSPVSRFGGGIRPSVSMNNMNSIFSGAAAPGSVSPIAQEQTEGMSGIFEVLDPNASSSRAGFV